VKRDQIHVKRDQIHVKRDQIHVKKDQIHVKLAWILRAKKVRYSIKRPICLCLAKSSHHVKLHFLVGRVGRNPFYSKIQNPKSKIKMFRAAGLVCCP